MAIAPLLPQKSSLNDVSISFNAAIIEASQLKTRAKCTMCAAKIFNCIFLPISIPFCSFVWFCGQGTYYTNQDGVVYCNHTACKSPWWLPRTQSPGYYLPKTTCGVFTQGCCDPCGCCTPFNDEISTRDYLPQDLHSRYKSLVNIIEIHRIIGPPQQSMGSLPAPAHKIDIQNLDPRAIVLATVVKKILKKTPPVSMGPLLLILEFLGSARYYRYNALYHPVVIRRI
jgi:hypothetical protein